VVFLLSFVYHMITWEIGNAARSGEDRKEHHSWGQGAHYSDKLQGSESQEETVVKEDGSAWIMRTSRYRVSGSIDTRGHKNGYCWAWLGGFLDPILRQLELFFVLHLEELMCGQFILVATLQCLRWRNHPQPPLLGQRRWKHLQHQLHGQRNMKTNSLALVKSLIIGK